jgi:O-Antigen ligase
MRALRPAFASADLPVLAAGALVTLGAVVATAEGGATFGLGSLLALALFLFAVAGFIAFPHLTVAAMIPLFAAIPAVKVIALPWFGPVKDVLTLAGAVAAGIVVVQRAGEGQEQRGDFWVAALVAFLIGLYILNLGGSMERDIAWAQGIRLVSEPLLLLLIGLVLPQARRTLRWAMASLIVTGLAVASIGILQQVAGEGALIELGYSYEGAVRTIDGRLRSFGTMDEPFAYAAFLLLALYALLMWTRRGLLTAIVASVIVTGLAFSYVRTALIVLIALVGLWLARSHRPTVAAFLLAVATVAAAVILIWSSEGTETRTVRGENSLFLTINGRTEAWKLVLDSPKAWMVGKGVGEVGTALERSTYSISVEQPDQRKASSVDSGYFATIADVGILGLVALLALVGRLLLLGKQAIDRGIQAGWLAVGFLSILLLDAVTRASFTGFPTAFLTLLLVGVALAASAEEHDARTRSASPARP